MAAVLTGTPTVIEWADGTDPATQDVTVPGDATAVYMFWAYGADFVAGHGLATVTLDGNSPDETFEIASGAGGEPATGVAAWYNPATGVRTVDVTWDVDPLDTEGGPLTIVAYVKDGETTGWGDADADADTNATAVTVTLTTNTDDLVLKFDDLIGATPPSTSTGWTSEQTQTNFTAMSGKLSSADTPGSPTTVCDSEDEFFSGIIAIAILDGVPPPPVATPPTIWVGM